MLTQRDVFQSRDKKKKGDGINSRSWKLHTIIQMGQYKLKWYIHIMITIL